MRIPKMFIKPANKVKANAPEILLVAGVGLVIYGTVKACQASRRLDSILDEHKEAMDAIHSDNTLDPPEVRQYTARRYGKTAWEMFRLYAPSVAIGGAGVCLIFKGHGILRQRYIAVVSAYKMLEKGYDVYRRRVINELGEDMDKHFRFGMTEEEIETTEISKSGKEKTVKKKVKTIDPDFERYSPYSRIFDEMWSSNWKDDPEYNKRFVIKMQNYANDYLKTHHKLFLNQVYEWLGFKQTVAGQKVGWLSDPEQPDGDDYVSFGIDDMIKRARQGDVLAEDWINGNEPNIFLDFNCKLIIDEAFDEEI